VASDVNSSQKNNQRHPIPLNEPDRELIY